MSIWERLVSAGGAMFEPREPSGAARLPVPVTDPDCGCTPDPDDVQFTAAVVGLGAKLAKADGDVSDAEVAMFSRVFRSEPRDWPSVRRVFDIARQSVHGYESYAKRIARRYGDRPCLLEGILDGLFHIAGADGVVTHEEMDYLRRVSVTFGFDEAGFRRIKSIHLGPDPEDPYEVLGVEHTAEFGDIRKAYRNLMAQHHPDRVIAQGAPREFEATANARAAAINSAFARIRAERGYLIRDAQ